MPLRERSWAALSRLPRWVTVLGIVALAGELTFAAVLAAGPPRARGPTGTPPARKAATPTAPAPQRATSAVPTTSGAAQTVLLQVEGAPLAVECTPVPPVPCGPVVGYRTSSTELDALLTPALKAASLPFTKTIRAKAGDIVTLISWSRTNSPLTCSITADDRVLSKITAATPNGDEASAADCKTTIPDSGTSPAAARRTAVLRVSAVPDATCSQAPHGCFPGVVSYTTPTGEAANFSAAAPLNAEVAVPAGGAVSLDVAGTAEELATCSITVNGRVLTKDTTHGSAGQADCQATIP